MRLNSPTFTASKVKDDLQRFIDGMEKIFRDIHASDFEGFEFLAYQLKEAAYQWYK